MEAFEERGFELLILLPGRTRAPRGWLQIIEGLPQRIQKTDFGIMLSVRSELDAEIDRIQSNVMEQPWGSEITEMWSRTYFAKTIYGPRPSTQKDLVDRGDQPHPLEMAFHLSRGIPITSEMVLAHRQQEAERRQRLDEEEQGWQRRYAEARRAITERNNEDYVAAQRDGDTRPYHKWVIERPELPPFDEWRRALEAGEEPRLLLPAAEDRRR